MRISEAEHRFIKEYWRKNFPRSSVYLFGSRADDQRRGGDIDILVINDEKLSIRDKVGFLGEFMNRFGEQKIDLVSFRYDENLPFKNIAYPPQFLYEQRIRNHQRIATRTWSGKESAASFAALFSKLFIETDDRCLCFGFGVRVKWRTSSRAVYFLSLNFRSWRKRLACASCYNIQSNDLARVLAQARRLR